MASLLASSGDRGANVHTLSRTKWLPVALGNASMSNSAALITSGGGFVEHSALASLPAVDGMDAGAVAAGMPPPVAAAVVMAGVTGGVNASKGGTASLLVLLVAPDEAAREVSEGVSAARSPCCGAGAEEVDGVGAEEADARAGADEAEAPPEAGMARKWVRLGRCGGSGAAVGRRGEEGGRREHPLRN